MEKFFSLPIEKQNLIIDAAMTVFGHNGYKKASTAEIAQAAGISKAMVFYYFGSKKELYLYLIEFSINIIKNELNINLDKSITDFFDRIKIASEIKMSVIKKHHSLFHFLKSLFFETDKTVENNIKNLYIRSEESKINALEGVDFSKFKDDIDYNLILKFLVWASEGFINEHAGIGIDDIDKFMIDFYSYLELMKKHFYKD